MAGFTWYFQFFFYTMGEAQMGTYRFSSWTLHMASIMIFGTLWNLIQPWPIWVWSDFWHVTAILIPVTMAVITGVWFTWGGIIDSIDLFRRLHLQKVNPLDSGFVVNHQNLDEAVAEDHHRSSGKESQVDER